MQRFIQLSDDLLRGKITPANIDKLTLMNIITDYAHEIEQTPREHFIAKQIEFAPDMVNVRVYQYKPGTGQASRQFYKFVRAIAYHSDIFKMRLSSQIILSVIKNYLEDQME